MSGSARMGACWSRVSILGAACLAAACAGVKPEASALGEEELQVRTTSWIAPQGLFESPGMLRTPDDLDGVRCVLSNDKGAWTFTSPGRIKVLRSLQPLQIECRHDRYHPARTVLNCVSPRQKAYEQRQRTKAGAIITAPAIVTAAVLAPPLGAALLAQEAAMAGLATHDANDMRGQDPDLCNYGSTMLVLTPRWP